MGRRSSVDLIPRTRHLSKGCQAGPRLAFCEVIRKALPKLGGGGGAVEPVFSEMEAIDQKSSSY